MTLSMLVLDVGRGDEGRPRLWTLGEVGPDAAVDVRYDDDPESRKENLLLKACRQGRRARTTHSRTQPNAARVRAGSGLATVCE